MSTLKIDIINKAYEKGRISGLTSSPTPEMISSALGELEDMAAKWAGPGKNICVGYNFEEKPDANSPHNIDRAYHSAFYNNLAVILLANFGKEPMPRLLSSAAADYSALSNATALVRDTVPSNRMPTGGKRRDGHSYRRQYYPRVEQAPIGCATNRMVIGDIDDFSEPFSSYLGAGEDISTYTLESDSGLFVVSQSLDSPDINYTVRADGGSSEEGYTSVQQIKIIATTTNARVETRVVNFELTEA